MTREQEAVTATDFARVSRYFGSDYSCDCVGTVDAEGNALFHGRVSTRQVASGPRVCFGAFEALRESRHSVHVPRAVYLSLPLQASEVEYSTGSNLFPVRRGVTHAMMVGDTLDVVGHYRRAQTLKALSIQVSADDVADPQLAERIDVLTRQTRFRSTVMHDRVVSLLLDGFDTGGDPVVQNLMVECGVLELLASCLAPDTFETLDAGKRLPPRSRARMDRAKEFMIANPEHPHSLKSLAREVGVSVTVLKTQFMLVHGESVFAFLRRLRLERARVGLEVHGWTVSEAASFVGFRHASNFSTAFRRHFGSSPSRITIDPTQA